MSAPDASRDAGALYHSTAQSMSRGHLRCRQRRERTGFGDWGHPWRRRAPRPLVVRIRGRNKVVCFVIVSSCTLPHSSAGELRALCRELYLTYTCVSTYD